MECLSTVSYSVLLNSTPKVYIVPRRRLRQGDPLSSYLFLLCAEGLTSLLQKAETQKQVHGIAISPGGGGGHGSCTFSSQMIAFYSAKRQYKSVEH